MVLLFTSYVCNRCNPPPGVAEEKIVRSAVSDKHVLLTEEQYTAAARRSGARCVHVFDSLKEARESRVPQSTIYRVELVVPREFGQSVYRIFHTKALAEQEAKAGVFTAFIVDAVE